jgi:predicted RNA-binding protein with PIN domain
VGLGSFIVIFSGNKEADTIIKERVSALSNARDGVVVTNDRSIQLHARKRGAKVISCEDFLASKPASSRPASPKGLDSATLGEINDELKSIWKIK